MVRLRNPISGSSLFLRNPVSEAFGIAPVAGPPITANLVGHYNASDPANVEPSSNDDPMETWFDGSGNDHDMNQTTGGNRPTYKTNIQNGLNIARFVNDDFLTAGNEVGFESDDFSIYAAISPLAVVADTEFDIISLQASTGAGANKAGFFLFQFGANLRVFIAVTDSTFLITGSTSPDVFEAGVFKIYTVTKIGDTVSLFMNGVSIGTPTTGNPLTISYTVAARESMIGAHISNGSVSNFFDGDKGEILVYSVGHDLAERATTRSYLGRWGP